MYCRIYNRDETQLKVGSELIWLWWVAIEPTKDKEILSITISKERRICLKPNIFLINSFKRIWLSFCFNIIWWHMVSTTSMSVSETAASPSFYVWKKHHYWKDHAIHQDKTESFDDYFPCKKRKCKLKHVQQWLISLSDYYNKEITA